PFEPAAKRQARVARSQAETRLAALDLAATLWQLRQEVARAWEELALARAEEALAGEEVSGRRALLHWVETLLRFGAGSQPDVLAAQGELARAEAQAAASATAIVKAKGDLARALGLPLEGMERIQLAPAELQALPEASTFGTAELGGEAVRNRLDLDRAVAAYARAEAALAAEVAAQVPDLSLGPGLTYDQGQKKLVFGVGLSLPNPPAARAAIRAAWFARERAAGEVERVQAEALAAVSAACARYRAASTEREHARAALEEQRRGLEAAEKRLALGAGNRGEVLAAQALALEAQRAGLGAERSRLEALGALEDAVQRPLWPPSRLAPARDATAIPGPTEKEP
ncbi:MAG: TolC family protein, partial [Thermoanaerobaculia bacterium]